MKGLKEFLELLENDQSMMKEVEKAQNDAAEIVKIAKKRGYEFTEDEFNDFLMEAVSGGGKVIDWFKDLGKKIEKKVLKPIKDDFEDTVTDVAAGFALDHPDTTVKLIKTFKKK